MSQSNLTNIDFCQYNLKLVNIIKDVPPPSTGVHTIPLSDFQQ